MCWKVPHMLIVAGPSECDPPLFTVTLIYRDKKVFATFRLLFYQNFQQKVRQKLLKYN